MKTSRRFLDDLEIDPAIGHLVAVRSLHHHETGASRPDVEPCLGGDPGRRREPALEEIGLGPGTVDLGGRGIDQAREGEFVGRRHRSWWWSFLQSGGGRTKQAAAGLSPLIDHRASIDPSTRRAWRWSRCRIRASWRVLGAEKRIGPMLYAPLSTLLPPWSRPPLPNRHSPMLNDPMPEHGYLLQAPQSYTLTLIVDDFDPWFSPRGRRRCKDRGAGRHDVPGRPLRPGDGPVRRAVGHARKRRNLSSPMWRTSHVRFSPCGGTNNRHQELCCA